MMHEFRLPADQKNTTPHNATAADEEVVRKNNSKYIHTLCLTKTFIILVIDLFSFVGLQEIWTLCRIFKRNVSYRKSTPDWRETSAKRKPTNSRPKTGNMDSENWEGYISFGAPEALDNEKKLFVGHNMNERNQFHVVSEPESCSSVLSDEAREFLVHGNWDEIVPAMDCAFDPYYF